MKRLAVSWLLWLWAFAVFAQLNSTNSKEFSPRINIAISSGSNNFTSYLGALAEIKLFKNVSALGGAGFGLWGIKTSVGTRYYRHYPKGIYYSLSYSTSSGLEKDTLLLQTSEGDIISDQEVILNLERTHNINLAIGYNWLFTKRLRCFIEIGYSILLDTGPLYELLDDDIQLTEYGKANIDYMAPGGIILGWGFSVGF